MHIIQGEISQGRSKIMNFYTRSYQLILRYLYSETVKRRGEISLHTNSSGFEHVWPSYCKIILQTSNATSKKSIHVMKVS